MSLGPPVAADVGEAQWQFKTAEWFSAVAGTCASSNCSLYTTNGILQTGFKSVDTNRCVCKVPYTYIDQMRSVGKDIPLSSPEHESIFPNIPEVSSAPTTPPSDKDNRTFSISCSNRRSRTYTTHFNHP
ncbi:hypothetical protein AVEN_133812-1 [Araneus ventricosus]|uniref:Uncharacterized protein n=1 Tax=Araneus ventricosus TaxID=182803 RepID=A0A4Y2K257_ARAVE|nr:hypothetical protein AVEN_133812-1 [Araneus ventricosus]